jgi:hypothetical protein
MRGGKVDGKTNRYHREHRIAFSHEVTTLWVLYKSGATEGNHGPIRSILISPCCSRSRARAPPPVHPSCVYVTAPSVLRQQQLVQCITGTRGHVHGQVIQTAIRSPRIINSKHSRRALCIVWLARCTEFPRIEIFRALYKKSEGPGSVIP